MQAEVKHPELDLISAVSKRDPERRKLLAEAKRKGHSRDCITALLYKSHSMRQAAEYMAKVDAE